MEPLVSPPPPTVTSAALSQGWELHFLFLLDREPQVRVIAVLLLLVASFCGTSWEYTIHEEGLVTPIFDTEVGEEVCSRRQQGGRVSQWARARGD